MQVFRSEIKVGLLILISFILLLVGIFAVSDLRSVLHKKKSIVLLFPYADGITKGSPVWYAGLEVGEVTDIRIAQGTNDRIAVTVNVSPDARVRKDSRVDIRNLGMMGSKYVEISPGSPESPLLTPGETLEGKSPASLSEVIETGQQVATHLVELVQETQTLIHQIRVDAGITETIQNTNGFVTDMRDRGQELRTVLKKLNTFADSLNETGRNVTRVSGEGGKEFTALLKELRETNRELRTRLENVEGRLTETLGQAEGFVKGARSLVSSNEEDISSLFRYLSETSRNIEGLSEDLKAHPWKVIWKEDGTFTAHPATGTDQWRNRGRVGPFGKE